MSSSNLSFVSTVATTGSGLWQPVQQQQQQQRSASSSSLAAAAGMQQVRLSSDSVNTVGAAGLTSSTASLNTSTTNLANYRVTNSYIGDETDQQNIQNLEARQQANAKRMERERLETWSWGITAWNVIACLLCPGCLYCMFGALLCNVFAYVDHRARDYPRKQKKITCAIGWSVGAFTAGIVAIIIIVIVLFVAYDAKDWNTIPTVPGTDFFM